MSVRAFLLSDLRYEELSAKYRFRLTDDLTIFFENKTFSDHDFRDQRGILRARVRGREWTILKNYAWDGCSPKFRAFGRWWGTPDYAETIAASCWHDSAGQFRGLRCMVTELSGGEWNQTFASIIESEGSARIAKTYLAGLTIGNPFYQIAGKLISKPQKGYCRK